MVEVNMLKSGTKVWIDKLDLSPKFSLYNSKHFMPKKLSKFV